ncbi:C40 family peptidase [Humibacillus xanthopallidus]
MPLTRFLLASAAAIALASSGAGVVLVSATITQPQANRPPTCVSSGGVSGLTAAQAQNARVIAATASQRAGHQGAFIALMVALAESDLRVLTNPNDPAGDIYANQGTGYDHDSLGLFQQRPGWGSAARRMDPAESTNLFVDALLRQGGWGTMPPWTAAQLVQRSAFTGRPTAANGGSTVMGGNYQRQAPRAAALLAAIEADSSALDCGGAPADALSPGGAGTHGLPNGYTLPEQTSPAGRIAVSFALAQLGKPYLWGGNGPDRFDCSGLTQQAWSRAGVTIGRVVSQQLRNGHVTSVAQLAPGDLVMIPGADGTIAAPGHVGMFIGRGLVVHAPRTGDVIRVVAFSSFVSKGLSGLRHIG